MGGLKKSKKNTYIEASSMAFRQSLRRDICAEDIVGNEKKKRKLSGFGGKCGNKLGAPRQDKNFPFEDTFSDGEGEEEVDNIEEVKESENRSINNIIVDTVDEVQVSNNKRRGIWDGETPGRGKGIIIEKGNKIDDIVQNLNCTQRKIWLHLMQPKKMSHLRALL